MATDMNLQFIREKISQIRTAVMYSMSNSLTRLPNDIVTAVRVDDEGQLWFVCRGPLPFMKKDEYEKMFPARLCFYRKGVDYFVEVSGKATIVNTNYSDNADEKSLLIKMNMMNIEYTEPNARKPKNKLELFLESGYKWFLRTAAINRGSESVLAKLHQTNYYGKNTA